MYNYVTLNYKQYNYMNRLLLCQNPQGSVARENNRIKKLYQVYFQDVSDQLDESAAQFYGG